MPRMEYIKEASYEHKRISARFIAGGNTHRHNLTQNSLRLNTGNIRIVHLAAMMDIVQDPLKCGYLLHFTTLEHNSENLCFIMMVSRFRDVVCQDTEVWTKSWIDIDVQVLKFE